ncbi:MAG: GNAT family N-acetyltransferase [Candidatus Dormibacteraceae bacterium]
MTEPLNYRIRQVRENDVECLADIDAYAQRLHSAAHPDVWREPDLAASARFFQQLLDEGNSTIVVSEASDGRPVGYALMRLVDKGETTHKYARQVLELEHLCVAEGHEGCGHGRALLEWVELFAQERGAEAIDLSVWGFNAFSRKMSYRIK